MNQDELNEILKLHELWLENDPSGVMANLDGANLEEANLWGANLTWANLKLANLAWANLVRTNLRGANLRGANLVGANLVGANLDFSVINLSCKGLNFTIDDRIAKQLIYHVINLMQHSDLQVDSIFKKSVYKWLESSHLVIDHNLPIIKRKGEPR